MKILLLLTILLLSWDSFSLVFIDNAVTNDTYIPSNKKRQIINAHKLALDDISIRHPKCKIKTKILIGNDGPLSFIKQAEENANFKDQFLVGFIHSSEALLAATVLKNSQMIALSSGASTDSLHITNPNFFSIANPISKITGHLVSFIKTNKVKKIGIIIPGNSSFSMELATKLREELLRLGQIINIEIASNGVNYNKYQNYELIFIPGFLQQTLPIIKMLNQNKFRGIVYGSANLARSKPDLDLFYSKLGLNDIKLMFPATWQSGENLKSKNLEKRFKREFQEEIMGTAIYTYDASTIAGEFLCQKNRISQVSFELFLRQQIINNSKLTIRRYKSLENGHLISSIQTVEYLATKKTFNKVFE
jgi:ABC-type branched-subunit amino acid transport system substrate-binding protein